ncbi:hypothetical protein HS041_12395 [Planomonospora sp. ID67723]|uniref:hypothetical protein n=1 Tax=Planomonospora sp. ID67723 TaxID=2738134 RepID=UPI0018C448F9|nr:hypothetical protein [Planomonospora sp. ID67723]MBG0828569.1 hypothetical protein [Planomonospora sp. ID67723]
MTEQPGVDVALAELRGLLKEGFAKLDGQVALVIQRLDHVDARHAELVRRVDEDRAVSAVRNDAAEKRLDALERDAVTRPQLAERTRQIIAIVGVMLTAASLLVALVLGLMK